MDLSSGIYYPFQILIKLGFQSVFTKSQKPEPLFYSEETQVIKYQLEKKHHLSHHREWNFPEFFIIYWTKI